jgi:uncharacterized protein (TIGR02145 family)
VASNAEWATLTNYLINNGYGYQGSGTDIGKSMAATSGWGIDVTPGFIGNDQASNNASGFSALPGGVRWDTNGTFVDIGLGGYWWCSSINTTKEAWLWYMANSSELVYNWSNTFRNGFSVRCIKDN